VKQFLISLLVLAGLVMSLHALDTGQMGIDIQKSQSVNGIEYTRVSLVEGLDHDKLVNIWHKDTLMYVSDNGLDAGINFNMATCNTVAHLATCSTKGGFAVDVGGV